MRRCGLVVLLWACAGPAEDPAFADHDTPLDLVELTTKSGVAGLPGSFDRDRVMDDAFFTAARAVDARSVQRFLERNPYGRRCFLADVRVSGRSAADAIVRGSREHGINPVVMLARMQVEKSLIAKTSSPGRSSVDFAFGCGCPDGRACNEAFRGLDRQIACAARTLRRHFDGSVAGSGAWRRGRSRSTLDPVRVTPANHATASLYAYTPWVLPGRGGNWLVWNVTTRFAAHFEAQGVDLGADGVAEPAPGAWIGTPCDHDTGCDFGAEGNGSCQRFDGGGICTLSCEGLCPDRGGADATFCVSASHFGEGEDFGVCTVEPTAANRGCADLPGMAARPADRYLGRSGSAPTRNDVCLPVAAAPAPEQPAPPEEPPPPPEEPPAPPEEPPAAPEEPPADPEERPEAPPRPIGLWVGDACARDAECGFIADGVRARCFLEHAPADGLGFCTLDCQGFCPDRDGRTPTFCAPVRSLGGAGDRGACAEQSHAANRHCAARPGMRELGVRRHVGRSRAASREAVVCAPELRGGGVDAGNGGVCEAPALPLSDHGASCAGVAHETWRCACSVAFERSVSQVCRAGRWVNYELDPRDCGRCDGAYSVGCEAG